MATRQLIVTDLKHIKSGDHNGEPFTLWQVRATGLDGIPISQNLRSFEELPKDVPITVEVGYFSSSRGYGDSFTLKQVEGAGETATVAQPSPPPPVPSQPDHEAVRDLQRRVAALEEQVQAMRAKDQTPVQNNGSGPPTPEW